MSETVDEFLVEIQTHLVESIPVRIREFSADQVAHFPSVPDLGATTQSLWDDLSKDFQNSELLDWQAYTEELKTCFLNPPFSLIWQSSRPETKIQFWDGLIQYFSELSKAFKVGEKSTFKPASDLVTKIQELQSIKGSSILESPISDIDDRLFLKCQIRGQNFIVPVSNVVEIQQMRKITPMPEIQKQVSGLLSSRGEMFPIFSLHELENYPIKNPFQYFVICEKSGHKFGFAVDNTDQVITVDRSQFQASSDVLGFQGANYIEHSLIIENHIYLVIEPEKIAS